MTTKFNARNSKASKLTPGKVMEMRERWASGDWTQGSLSKEYGVSVIQVGRIVRGESWQSLAMPFDERKMQASQERIMRLAEEINAGGESAQLRLAADITRQRTEDNKSNSLLEELLEADPNKQKEIFKRVDQQLGIESSPAVAVPKSPLDE